MCAEASAAAKASRRAVRALQSPNRPTAAPFLSTIAVPDDIPPMEKELRGGQQLVLTVAEVARRLGVPTRTVRHWSDIGYLPARRTPGGQRRYSPAEVAAFATRRRVAAD